MHAMHETLVCSFKSRNCCGRKERHDMLASLNMRIRSTKSRRHQQPRNRVSGTTEKTGMSPGSPTACFFHPKSGCFQRRPAPCAFLQLALLPPGLGGLQGPDQLPRLPAPVFDDELLAVRLGGVLRAEINHLQPDSHKTGFEQPGLNQK